MAAGTIVFLARSAGFVDGRDSGYYPPRAFAPRRVSLEAGLPGGGDLNYYKLESAAAMVLSAQ